MTAPNTRIAAQSQAVNPAHIAIEDIASLGMTGFDWLEAICYAIEKIHSVSPD